MFREFKWSALVAMSLAILALIFSFICFNLPENPAPNQTVLLPGADFMWYGWLIIFAAFLISKIRNGLFFSFSAWFQPNFIEAYLALVGVAIFLSPLLALLFKFFRLVLANALNT
jgi:hypothetical protein